MLHTHNSLLLNSEYSFYVSQVGNHLVKNNGNMLVTHSEERHLFLCGNMKNIGLPVAASLTNTK